MARIRRVVAADGPSTQPRWGVLQRLAEVAGHPDKALAEDAQQPDGFRLLGRLPAVPQWPQRPEPPAWDDAAHVRDLQRLLDKHAVKQKDGRFKVPGSHSAELHRLLEEETTKGFWTSYSWSEARQELGDFACWLYFGVQEPSKLRGCLDPEEANGPSMVLLPNQVLMAGLDGYLSLCQTVAAAFKKKGQLCGALPKITSTDSGSFLCPLWVESSSAQRPRTRRGTSEFMCPESFCLDREGPRMFSAESRMPCQP